MFKRRQADPTEPSDRTDATRASTDAATGGKGRPTLSRREAEAERKQRLQASARGESGGTGRAAAASDKAARRAERSAARERMMNGEERALPARDRGPERRLARDIVDARRTIGEYFLPIAVVILVIGLIRVSVLPIVAQALLLGLLVALGIDMWRVSSIVNEAVRAKYPNGDTKGVGRYAAMRSIVSRRRRVPKPQVTREPLFKRN